MSKRLHNELSKRERQIMDVIYRRNSASVKEVLEEIPDPPSYSAVRALINVLEGTLVEQLGDQQARTGTGQRPGMQPAGAGDGQKKNRAAREKPGEIAAENPDGESGQVKEKPARKKSADPGDKDREKKKRTKRDQPE